MSVLLSQQQAAEYLGISPRQLRRLNVPFVSLGLRAKGYRPETLHAWKLGIPPLAPSAAALKEVRIREAREAMENAFSTPAIAVVIDAAWQTSIDANARKQEQIDRRPGLYAYHANKRRAAKIQRTPSWADHDAIRLLYAEAARLTAETGVQHHVDHIIPMQGEVVSGLHVENNLQILTASENSRKKNRYEVEP